MSIPRESDLLTQQAEQAGYEAFTMAIAQGLPVFYYDWDHDLDIMQQRQ